MYDKIVLFSKCYFYNIFTEFFHHCQSKVYAYLEFREKSSSSLSLFCGDFEHMVQLILRWLQRFALSLVKFVHCKLLGISKQRAIFTPMAGLEGECTTPPSLCYVRMDKVCLFVTH